VKDRRRLSFTWSPEHSAPDDSETNTRNDCQPALHKDGIIANSRIRASKFLTRVLVDARAEWSGGL
jgi:hypothetical protein